jgi:hypothetical protein
MSIRPKGSGIPTHKYVLVFTDKRFQDQLDARFPGWREYHWYVVHNPKDTKDTARHMAYNLHQVGLRLLPDDDGTTVEKVPSE